MRIRANVKAGGASWSRRELEHLASPPKEEFMKIRTNLKAGGIIASD